MLISSADLSFTQAALSTEAVDQKADNLEIQKNSFHTAYSLFQDIPNPNLGDLAIARETFGGPQTLKVFNQIGENKIWTDFSTAGGNIDFKSIRSYNSSDGGTSFREKSLSSHSGRISGEDFYVNSATTREEVNYSFQLDEQGFRVIYPENQPTFGWHGYEELKNLGNFPSFESGSHYVYNGKYSYEIKAENANLEIFSTGQTLLSATKTIIEGGSSLDLVSTAMITASAPVLDLTKAPLRNARSETGAMFYENGTGQADYRGITSNENPINVNGQKALIAGGIRVRQNEASFYVGVHPTQGALRVVDYNGYNNGTFNYRPATASAWQVGSSRSYKEHIEDFSEDALSIIKKSKVYKYDYKENDENGKQKKKEKEKDNKKRKIGVMAEEATEILGEDGLSVDIYKMTSINWKAIQEIAAKLDEIEKQVKGKK